MESGPADGYRTPVVRNRKKPSMTAAEMYETTVNTVRNEFGKYWEGRGISTSYELRKGKCRDDAQPESTSDTIVQAGAVILSKMPAEDKEIIQLDIVTAFLGSGIEEELYLKLQKHFTMAKSEQVE